MLATSFQLGTFERGKFTQRLKSVGSLFPSQTLPFDRSLGLTLTVKDGMINAHGQRTPEVMSLLEQMKPMKADILAALQPDLDFAIEDVEPLPLDPVPPMRVKSAKPPLPREMWQNGLTPADAMDALDRLSADYYCTCGADNTGWYVRCDPKHYTVIC